MIAALRGAGPGGRHLGRPHRARPGARSTSTAGAGTPTTGSASTPAGSTAWSRGRTRWEELLLSLRFSARREPDVYNDYLVGLLKHADLAALRAVEEFEAARDPEETIEVAARRQAVLR